MQRVVTRLIASESFVDFAVLARVAAQSWVAYDLTGSSFWVGAVAGVRAVPSLISPGLVAGIADRFNRRMLIAAMRSSIGILAIVQALLIATGAMRPWHQMALTLFTGIAIAVAGPVFLALLYDHTNQRLATRANSMLALIHNSGEMIGPVIVGVVIASIGTEWVFVGIGLLCFASAFLVSTVPLPTRNTADVAPRTSYVTTLKTGIRQALRYPPLIWMFAIIVATNLFGVTVFPLLPEYATEEFASGGLGFGFMACAIGAGFAIGNATVAIFGINRRRGRVLLISSLVWGLGIFAFAYSPNLPIALCILLLMGCAGMIWGNAVLGLIRAFTPSHARAQVMSLYTIGMGLIPIGWMVGGALAQLAGNQAALIISAIASIALPSIAYIASGQFRDDHD